MIGPDKLSVSWLLIIPCCLFPNTVLAVKHLIRCKKELVFDPTCRTSAGNRFPTPSRIFFSFSTPTKTNQSHFGRFWLERHRGNHQLSSDQSLFYILRACSRTVMRKNWQHRRPEKLAKGKKRVSFITNIQIILSIRKRCR